MLKKQSRRSDARRGTRGRKSRVAALIILALVCVISTSLLAQVDLQRRGKRASGEVSIMSLSGPPAKEYIYAGTKLIATVEPTAVQGNDAEFVSMCAREDFENPPTCVPIGTGSPFGDPSQTYLVFVTMRNTGTTTWTAGAGYQLGSQNPANTTTWGITRAPLPTSVSPGQPVTIQFGARKPGFPPDFFNFQWQMVQDGGVGYFGEKTKNGIVSAGAWLPQGSAPNYATFVSQSVPSSMFAGQSYSVSVTMNNGGTSTWTTAGNYKLGSQLPQDNTNWGPSRVAVPSSVAPGANATFNFTVTAPSTPGTYNFQWMMVQDGGVGWFGTLSAVVAVSVTPPPPAAPSNLFAGFVPPGVTEITITWSDNSNNEDGFKVERLDGNSGWVQIATVSPNVTTYTATGLQLDNQYCYRVRAYNGSGNSAYSNQDCKWTSSGGG